MLNLGLHRLVSAVLTMLAASPPAQAHLMVAQRGTLNIVGDGKLSATEFAAHHASFSAMGMGGIWFVQRVLDLA
jgi:hypothetical protein